MDLYLKGSKKVSLYQRLIFMHGTTTRSLSEVVEFIFFCKLWSKPHCSENDLIVLRSRCNPVKLDQFMLSWLSVFDVVFKDKYSFA